MEGYTHDSIMQGNDSVPYVYTKIGSPDVIHFHKEYKRRDRQGSAITKDGLIFYHMLHRLLSRETIILEYDQSFLGKGYKGVKVSILDLDPQDVCDATIVSTKERIWATNPKYVSGQHPQTFEREIQDSDTSQSLTTGPMRNKIVDAIYKHTNEIIKSVLQTSDEIGYLRVELVNMKVVQTKSDDNYLHVVVTDLGASITGLIRFNNIKVKEARKLLMEAYKRENRDRIRYLFS